MKRPAAWQLEKQRTAKALRELPKCELCGIKKATGFAWAPFGLRVGVQGPGAVNTLQLCPSCAQRAQRERT